MAIIKINSDLDFNRVAKAIGLILENGDTNFINERLINVSQIAYDTEINKLKIVDSTNNIRFFIDDADIVNSITAPSSNKIPTVNAVLNEIYANTISKTIGTFDIIETPNEYPKGHSDNAVGAVQVGDGSLLETMTSSKKVRKGDMWYIINQTPFIIGNNGTNVDYEVKVGDILVALVDDAGNNNDEWLIIKGFINPATESSRGIIRIATESESLDPNNDNTTITPKKLNYWYQQKTRKIESSVTIGNNTIVHQMGTTNFLYQIFDNTNTPIYLKEISRTDDTIVFHSIVGLNDLSFIFYK